MRSDQGYAVFSIMGSWSISRWNQRAALQFTSSIFFVLLWWKCEKIIKSNFISWSSQQAKIQGWNSHVVNLMCLWEKQRWFFRPLQCHEPVGTLLGLLVSSRVTFPRSRGEPSLQQVSCFFVYFCCFPITKTPIPRLRPRKEMKVGLEYSTPNYATLL